MRVGLTCANVDAQEVVDLYKSWRSHGKFKPNWTKRVLYNEHGHYDIMHKPLPKDTCTEIAMDLLAFFQSKSHMLELPSQFTVILGEERYPIRVPKWR